ncbi:MAG: transposase [Nitrospirae bacterium]|nr:transposase [Nitrospirota bacterium]
MARKPRIHLVGGVYHVMLRGNGGQPIFFTEADRYHLYLLLQEGVFRYGYRVHAYCLMKNHLHLAIQVGEKPLSKIMQNLAFRYTRWINRQQKRVGHLFQGRYKSILVEKESYLLELVRYIHLNPVRVGWVKDPKEYRWSSHLSYLGINQNPWLTTEWILKQLGKTERESRQRYEKFIWEGIDEDYREEFHSGEGNGRILGEDRFIEEVLAKAEKKIDKPVSLHKIVKAVCHHYGLKEEELSARGQGRRRSEARAMIGWLAIQKGSATLTEVGKRFGRDVATLSVTIRRLRERVERTETLRMRVAQLESIFNVKK